jgi:molybdate transport system substrate-binding protein
MAADIRVLSSLATREAYVELVPQFEAATGHKITTTWAGTVDIMKRMAAGEVFDLVISSSGSLADLIKQGHIVAGSSVDLAKTGIGIGVRKGARRPDVASGDALKRAILAAGSIGLSTGPSGVYLEKLFDRLGIAEAVKAKTRQIPSGGTVATLIANGDVELGFQQISEVAYADGVDYVGPLPSELQLISVFTAGIHTKAAHPEAAAELVKFLTAPAGNAVMKKHGLERP